MLEAYGGLETGLGAGGQAMSPAGYRVHQYIRTGKLQFPS